MLTRMSSVCASKGSAAVIGVKDAQVSIEYRHWRSVASYRTIVMNSAAIISITTAASRKIGDM